MLSLEKSKMLYDGGYPQEIGMGMWVYKGGVLGMAGIRFKEFELESPDWIIVPTIEGMMEFIKKKDGIDLVCLSLGNSNNLYDVQIYGSGGYKYSEADTAEDALFNLWEKIKEEE